MVALRAKGALHESNVGRIQIRPTTTGHAWFTRGNLAPVAQGPTVFGPTQLRQPVMQGSPDGNLAHDS